MKIISDDKQSELLIESCCPELTCYPSVWVNLQLKTPEVTGRQDGVWISEDALNRFLDDLNAFDATRKGNATLRAMSPESFAMTLFPLDSLGHIGLKTTMQGGGYRLGGTFLTFSVEASFEIDATSIPQITSGFKELIDEQTESTS
jgi:hypothetical protein